MTRVLLNAKIAKNNTIDFSQEQYDKLLKKDDLLSIDLLMTKHFDNFLNPIMEKLNNIKEILEDMKNESTLARALKK